MNITLHIERLVLDGLPVASGQWRTVQAAIERELAGLLEERGIGNISAGAVPHLPVASIQLSSGGHPAQWGRQIARALYDSIAPTPIPSLLGGHRTAGVPFAIQTMRSGPGTIAKMGSAYSTDARSRESSAGTLGTSEREQINTRRAAPFPR